MTHPRLHTTRNYVIDLETLALGPNAVVTSAALAQFDPRRHWSVKTWTVDTIAQQRDGRVLDAETVLWWLRQPEQARMSVAGEEALRARVHPRVFLLDLLDILAPRKRNEAGGVLKTRDCDFTLWAKPQHFDIAILEHMARQYKVPEHARVLHRRRLHNVRTALAMVNLLRPDSMEDIDEAHAGDAVHDAAADALRTAEVMQRAMAELLDLRAPAALTPTRGTT